MKRIFPLTVFATALALPTTHVSAQDLLTEERIAAAEEASATAAQMVAVQQAAALAQLQYLGMVGGRPEAAFRGAIVLPSENSDIWDAVIIGRTGDAPDADYIALAEYEISGGAIRSEVLHRYGERPVLGGTVSAMAQAKAFAPRAVLAAGNTTFCASDDASPTGGVTFITIVLPAGEDGSFSAYVLNGPIEEGALPLGRHFRVDFDQFGLTGEPELLTDTCEVITWEAADPQLHQRVYRTDHTGDVPTEIHAFLAAQMPMAMAVTTGEISWPINDGVIGAPQPIRPASD